MSRDRVSAQIVPFRHSAAIAVGGVNLPNRVLLAPMSGITDAPFRRLAVQLGAGLVISEMTASDALASGEGEAQLRAAGVGLALHAVQLAGCEPHWMGEGARIAAASGADIIDINMGCPARRVTSGYAGSALMRDLDHASHLIEAAVAAVAVPVTLKMRLGWDQHSINAPELARRAEQSGVRCIRRRRNHGRARRRGPAVVSRPARPLSAIRNSRAGPTDPEAACADGRSLWGNAPPSRQGSRPPARPQAPEMGARRCGRECRDRLRLLPPLSQRGAHRGGPRPRHPSARRRLFRLVSKGRGMNAIEPQATSLLPGSADIVFNALPHPVLMVAPDGRIAEANVAAEDFFEISVPVLRRHVLRDLVPFGSPLLALIEQVRGRAAPVNEYRVDLGTPRNSGERIVDLHVAPVPERRDHVVVMLLERTIADKLDRQLTHRGAARSVSALAAMLAHEIKNPLSGIRGAAQLLEQSAGDDDRTLTRLICDEADRIVKLVDRMEVFSDQRPVERESVNIHVVLDHVKRLAQTGFARHIKFVQEYDPSLPPVLANRDQLIQVFLNLVKNAAEAIGEAAPEGEIQLTTAFRPGMRLSIPGNKSRVSLPLEFCVRDNGPGVPEDLLPHLFDPFVTTKPKGSGLGLAL